MKYYDIHTHQSVDRSDVVSIVNRIVTEDGRIKIGESGYFSCGIHPWYITDPEKQLALLRQLLASPNVVAVGESGLDKLSKVPMETQLLVFQEQISLSEETAKPLVIHCVKAWSELLALKKDYNPAQPWIIHGFRGKGELAEQLLQHGIYLSFGKLFNPEALHKAWPNGVLAETDEQDVDIHSVYDKMADTLSLSNEVVLSQISENVHKIFSLR